MSTHILFVCTANLQRSKTAEDYFSKVYPEYIFKSAGTNQRICEQYNTTLLDESLLGWADMVFVMEEKHKQRIIEHTDHRFLSKITVLGIEDIYVYDDPLLIQILESKLKEFLS